MIKIVNSLLRLVIPLLLVVCSQPIFNDSEQTTLQSFQESSELAQFTPAILESSIQIFNLTNRESHKPSDNHFQYALISDKIQILSPPPLLCILFDLTNRFTNKIWLDAASTRAPPIFIS